MHCHSAEKNGKNVITPVCTGTHWRQMANGEARPSNIFHHKRDQAMTAQQTTDSELLARIDARNQLHDVVTRWSRGVDRCDRELILSTYHPDAWDDHGIFAGGPEAFADWVIDLHMNSFVWTAHRITNEYFEIDGDKAVGECYVIGTLRFERDGKLVDLMGMGRYLDRFEKRDGVWRFTFRTSTVDWNRIDPVDEHSTGELVNGFRHGKRGKEDPSYEFLSGR